MTDVTSDKMYDRILHSLRENSAEFARKERAQRMSRLRWTIYGVLIFASGVIAGALIIKAL